MKNYFTSGLWAGILLMSTGVVSATTVEVDAVGGATNKYATIKDALDALRTDANTPHTINITVNTLTDSKQLLVDFPVTINGDGNNDNIPVQISINTDSIKAETNIGIAGFNYIEVQTAGNVEIKNIIAHTIKNGSTTTCGALTFSKPASGTGNYTVSNVTFTGSDKDELILSLDTLARRYYHSSPGPGVAATRIWYGYLEPSGIITATNLGGSGSYNATLNDCKAGMCRSNALIITNQSGFVHVNGGLYGHAGEDAIRVIGATDVEIKGTATNRVKLIKTSMSSNGNGIQVKSGAVVKKLEYVDIVSAENNGTTANMRAGINIAGGTIQEINYVRVGQTGGESLLIPSTNTSVGTVNVKNSTFAASEKITPETLNTGINPIKIENGIVNFTDCVFSSWNLGTAVLNGGTVNFTNCAIPTDATAKESLATASPFSGTATFASNTSPVSASPIYETQAFDPTVAADLKFLAITSPAYATANSVGGVLTGGAGPNKSNVTDWVIY